MSEFNALFEANKDKQVAVTNKVTNVAANYRISQLSDKLGTMKNGDKNAYVILTAEDGTSTVINLHPQSAQKLFKKGEDGHMKIVEAPATEEVVHPAGWELVEGSQEGVIAKAEAEAVVAAPVAEEPEAEAAPVEEAKQETVTETKAEVNADKGTEEAAPKEKSKKERTIEIVHAGWDAGQERKEIIAKLRTELNMGVPGSNTYYQNVLSGNWGGRKGPASGGKK